MTFHCVKDRKLSYLIIPEIIGGELEMTKGKTVMSLSLLYGLYFHFLAFRLITHVHVPAHVLHLLFCVHVNISL